MAFTFQQVGVKNVRVNVTDADGDMATTMKAITVSAAGSTPAADTTAPNTSITSGPTGTTTDNTPTFAFTASESGSMFQCRLDSGAWAACTSPWTTNALADGMHGIAVRATDTAGNTDATPATQSFTVAVAAAPQTLIGDSNVQSSPDSNAAGTAEAFRATARASGTTMKMSAYVATGNHRGHDGGRHLQRRQRPSRDAADQGHALGADRGHVEHRRRPRRVTGPPARPTGSGCWVPPARCSSAAAPPPAVAARARSRAR
jgi:hypothetical protein